MNISLQIYFTCHVVNESSKNYRQVRIKDAVDFSGKPISAFVRKPTQENQLVVERQDGSKISREEIKQKILDITGLSEYSFQMRIYGRGSLEIAINSQYARTCAAVITSLEKLEEFLK